MRTRQEYLTSGRSQRSEYLTSGRSQRSEYLTSGRSQRSEYLTTHSNLYKKSYPQAIPPPPVFECVGKRKGGYSKDQLVQMAIRKGMKSSAARQSRMTTLCRYLNIPIPLAESPNVGILLPQSSAPEPCMFDSASHTCILQTLLRPADMVLSEEAEEQVKEVIDELVREGKSYASIQLREQLQARYPSLQVVSIEQAAREIKDSNLGSFVRDFTKYAKETLSRLYRAYQVNRGGSLRRSEITLALLRSKQELDRWIEQWARDLARTYDLKPTKVIPPDEQQQSLKALLAKTKEEVSLKEAQRQQLEVQLKGLRESQQTEQTRIQEELRRREGEYSKLQQQLSELQAKAASPTASEDTKATLERVEQALHSREQQIESLQHELQQSKQQRSEQEQALSLLQQSIRSDTQQMESYDSQLQRVKKEILAQIQQIKNYYQSRGQRLDILNETNLVVDAQNQIKLVIQEYTPEETAIKNYSDTVKRIQDYQTYQAKVQNQIQTLSQFLRAQPSLSEEQMTRQQELEKELRRREQQASLKIKELQATLPGLVDEIRKYRSYDPESLSTQIARKVGKDEIVSGKAAKGIQKTTTLAELVEEMKR